MDASVVVTTVASAVTFTTWPVLPISMCKSIVVGVFTRSCTPSRVMVVKPGFSTSN